MFELIRKLFPKKEKVVFNPEELIGKKFINTDWEDRVIKIVKISNDKTALKYTFLLIDDKITQDSSTYIISVNHLLSCYIEYKK